MTDERVVVIGAGIGGLVAALGLSAAGLNVTVVEKAAAPGGKMRAVAAGPRRVEAGPTVFTMRWVFEEIFSEAGADLAARVSLTPAGILARHAWSAGERLDLFADPARSEAAIADFAGPREAEGFRRFRARAAEIYRTLETPFIREPRPNPLELALRVGPRGLGDLWRIQPFATLWTALCAHFRDPRLRQLFGRYATYCGSSPFEAPATLMLVAHVEQEGVWTIAGGLSRLAAAVAELAAEKGAALRYGAEATGIVTAGGRVAGVALASGERLPATRVVANADVAALAAGLFGPEAARAVDPVPREARSLSAVTFAVAGRPDGFPLVRHNVFFSRDYQSEFVDLTRRRRLPEDPTVYVCAQDRGDDGVPETGRGPDHAPEALLALVNAPARDEPFSPQEIARCHATMSRRLSACGLTLAPEAETVTAPPDFATLFPGTGGALYGRASHGWTASFRRPGARTRLPGLYLAGGSAHPGPGVPMAAQSGRLAARQVLRDLAST
ncbi:phytoene desaturase [Methylobacterium sp. 4-46]|uniref:1-hydroxycarotenoid 3,4-desaturase CrtD n=1 Tax=unclassified Methylobacterium TaxID=2615210 RepID=UPI000165C7AF|nr:MULTISPECIES: 1-hydroxycarotenoid 3,4-desaturase CrtD [Methylobacterium]ACA18074.1 phytoene desaturase [Methylobacterium sp. 4-46]WFT77374.1 phytoene desaturase family protein [Methylobacterium nodulans]